MNVPLALPLSLPPGVALTAPVPSDALALLSAPALGFVAMLERRFRAARRRLLADRRDRQATLDAGARPDFLPETATIRAADWRIARVPADLQDRRVEITGPVERKMVINALNSGANAFMADFEDSLAPSWNNLLAGQRNLFDAVRRTIAHTDPQSGKSYRLQAKTAVLIVRPRGWHLDERHMLVDGEPVAGALFDFGLFLFHNAGELRARGSGPYFYLPKLENHHEARLWNLVFETAQQALGLPRGTIKATVLIETVLAAFEMDEILWELRDHVAGLNCGRWDYIFSFIKKFRNHPDFVLPDRARVGMTQPFLRAYSRLLIETCHRRGAHAMGGMAAQIPIKGDATANAQALARVRADKEREAGDGHDGTWVAHPALVPVAKEVFDRLMPTPNQIGRRLDAIAVTARDLLTAPADAITETGLRQNLSVGVQYTAAWLAGHGCVPIDHLMEDAATAEISRAQLWQWRRHGVRLADGRTVDDGLIRAALADELQKLAGRNEPRPFGAPHLREAAGLFLDLVLAPQFTEFLTLPAYDRILATEATQQDTP